jgi:phosphate starvation-inducible PhoH-like protein
MCACSASLSSVILRHSFDPPDNLRLANLCGPLDAHLRRIEAALAVRVSRRNEFFRIEGPRAPAETALDLLQRLYGQATQPIGDETLELALLPATAVAPSRAPPAAARSDADDPIVLHTRRTDLAARTPNP